MDVLTLESHAKDLLIYLNELFMGKSLCDVHVRSADGVYFPAHKIIIASSSIHIYQMVMSTPEASQLNLNVHSHVLHVLLEFIYTGKLMVQRHLWLDLQNAATLLQMYNLLDLMKRFESGEVTSAVQSTSQQLCMFPDNSDKQLKSEPKITAEVGTMTDDQQTNDVSENDSADNLQLDIVKKEKPELKINKNLELLYYDPKGGPISRLRPLVRPNFKKMHEEFDAWTQPSKRKAKQMAEASGKNSKRKSKKKKRKYAKRLNKFGKEMRFKCLYCSQRFKLLFKRHKHMCKSHTKRYYSWLYSGFAMKKILRIRSGLRMNRKKTLKMNYGMGMCNDQQTGARKIYYCRLCHMRFFKHSLFMFHFGKAHAARFKISWFHYVSGRALRLPNKKNRLKREFPCSKCHKSFVSEDTLAMHYERYHYDTNDGYQVALLNKLKEKRADNSCKICGKTYNFRSSLSRHMVHHKQDQQHQCSVCGKVFQLKAGLKEHAVVHEADKMCVCAVCGKSYKHRQSLRRHMTEHDPDRKEFVCTFCGKVFYRNEKFLKHLKVHENQHGGGNNLNLNNLQVVSNLPVNSLPVNSLPVNSLQPPPTPFTFLTF